MQDPAVTSVDPQFGIEVDSMVDQLDTAYQDGREDLGNQVIELIQQFEAEDIPADVALTQVVRFIENSLAGDGDEGPSTEEMLADIDALYGDPYFPEAA